MRILNSCVTWRNKVAVDFTESDDVWVIDLEGFTDYSGLSFKVFGDAIHPLKAFLAIPDFGSGVGNLLFEQL